MYPLGVTSTALRVELVEDPKTKLRRPVQPAHARWARVASAFPHLAWQATPASQAALIVFVMRCNG